MTGVPQRTGVEHDEDSGALVTSCVLTLAALSSQVNFQASESLH